jgi:hypothetical protein
MKQKMRLEKAISHTSIDLSYEMYINLDLRNLIEQCFRLAFVYFFALIKYEVESSQTQDKSS